MIRNIAITGDTHGDRDFKQFIQAKNMGYKKIIVCGDFGYIWSGLTKESEVLDRMNEIGIEILFIDGNHENFDILDNAKEDMRYGGRVHRIRDNIFHLIRGEVYDIDGYRFLAFGGANSIDKNFRTPGVSWWEREMPDSYDKANLEANIAKAGYNVDFILTHEIFSEAAEVLVQPLFDNKLSIYLSDIRETVSYNHWFFGHYHEDEEIEEYDCTCLFNSIADLNDYLEMDNDFEANPSVNNLIAACEDLLNTCYNMAECNISDETAKDLDLIVSIIDLAHNRI